MKRDERSCPVEGSQVQILPPAPFVIKMNKWKLLGYLLAVIDPLPAGFLLGLVLSTEKKYKKLGKDVMLLSLIMTAIYITIVFLVLK